MACDDLEGGLYGPSDGYIDGHLYCDTLATAVIARGGRVLQGTELVGCDPLPGDRTGFGRTAAPRLRRRGQRRGRLGRTRRRPPRRTDRDPAATAPGADRAPRRAARYVMPSVMDYVPSSGGFGAYFRDDGPGRLVAGLHTEEVIHDIVDPDAVVRDTASDYIELVAERLAQRLPRLADMRLGDVWAGIYPMRPDGRPVVGPHDGRASVVTVAGAGGSGLQSSPALGRIAADWILDGAADGDPGGGCAPAPARERTRRLTLPGASSEAGPRTIGPVDRGPARRYYSRTCRLHRLYASAGPMRPVRRRTRRPPEVDAQEIKTAVAHQEAARSCRRGAVRQPARPGAGARAGRPARPSAAARRSGRTSRTRSGTTGAGSSAIGSTISRRSSRSSS